MKRKFKQKYRNKEGFASGAEGRFFNILKKNKKIKVQYEAHRIPYSVPKNYIPDYTVTKSDGSMVFLEFKGWFRSEDQSKMRAVKRDNPDLDIRMIFMKDGRVQGSKMLNSEWCTKYKYPYHIGETIPKGWF